MSDLKENVIEWITGDDYISCTLTQKKYINKVRKIVDKRPELRANFYENKDGSIFCHLPLKTLKLYLNTSVQQGVEEDDEEV